MKTITRDEAFTLLKKYNKDPFHIQHALTVEAVMKWYANELGYAAAIIGIASGFIVVFGIEFIDKVLKIDDPVGAVGVHGLNGAFGTLAVGLFSDGSGTDWKGLLTGGGFHGFGVQFTGMIITIAWVVVTMTIIFQVIKHTIGLRVSAEEEIAGLDSKEHGLASAYDGFAMAGVPTPMGTSIKAPVVTARPSAPAESVPELPKEGVHKLTKVVIITRQNKLDEFMQAMNEIGVTGITRYPRGFRQGQLRAYRIGDGHLWSLRERWHQADRGGSLPRSSLCYRSRARGAREDRLYDRWHWASHRSGRLALR